jgi:hypothetical protein
MGMSDQAKQMTEFEYADRLAELLSSLQNDVMQPLRSRLKEIGANADESNVASERELKRQTSQINEHLKEALQETEDKNKKLMEKRQKEEDSRNGLIRHYQKSLADVRENCSRIQRALQTKGLSTPAEQSGTIDSPPLDDSILDNIIRDGVEAFQQAQQVLSGPLARFNASRFKLQTTLIVLAFGGFTGFIVFIMLAAQIQVGGSYIFWMFVLGCGATWGLRSSMKKNNDRFSDFFEYPGAKQKIIAIFLKLNEFANAIEKGTPKRVEKIEFEKKSKLGELDRSLAEARESFEQAEARIRSDQVAVEQQHQARLDKIKVVTHNAKTQLTQEFLPRVAEQRRAVKTFWEQTHQASAEWADPVWRNWQPDPSPEFAARLGKLVLEDSALSEELPELTLKFELPGLMPFNNGRFLLLEAKGNARTYIEAIQSLMLRALANVPPGKLRFTFIDPIGLGQNVAPFLALGDLDERLISGGAWSESQHIEQRLNQLTAHINTVIQKYLRNDYASIRDYNLAANEVAEAFRFLVIFDFPANFNDSALDALVKIIHNGPRCGVFTLLVRNTAKPLPYGFNFDAELRALAFAPYHQLAH